MLEGSDQIAIDCSDCGGRCCLDQRVILSKSDIDRIASRGYKLEDFAEFRDGFWRLKNYMGPCVFLDRRTGKCTIHEFKPTVCRLYPVIYFDGKVAIDVETCPKGKYLTEDDVFKVLPTLILFLLELKSADLSGRSGEGCMN